MVRPMEDAVPSHFTLRMQFGPHQRAEHIADQLLALVRRAPIDEIMFFLFAEELNDGHESIERIRRWLEHSRVYRNALADAGVTISLNPWHTLGHIERHRRLKPGQNWQTMVDQNGRAAPSTVCPLDENWQAYYEQTLRLYAKEDVRVIWIDDDFRLHNHQPLDGGGCFCELHVAEFNRRAGVTATRQQIVANITAPGEPHPWRGIWLDMWDDTLTQLLARWRDIVETEGARLGLMTSHPEAHAMEGRRWQRWWLALAGDQPPIHRPSFWPYGDQKGEVLPGCIASLDQNRTLELEAIACGPEIENYQYGPWARSFRQTGAQLALAHVLGATELNITLYDFLGTDPLDEPGRLAFLTEWRPTCDWLADEFPITLRSHGVGLPWSQDMSRKVHTDGSGRWQSLRCPTQSWANWVGGVGHAFQMRPSPQVNAIAGHLAWTCAEEDLRTWLSRGLLLDGPAAHILVERGLGDLIGIRAARMLTQDEVLYSAENCLDAAFSVRAGAQISINTAGYAAQMLQGELLEGARIVSDLRGPTQDVVGHGLVLFENELGGRVAVVPWCADGALHMTTARAVQLTRTLDWLDPKRTHGCVAGGAWLIPQFLTDGRLWRGVVWNANPDEISEFTLHRPGGMPEPTTVVHVDAHGRRREGEIDGERVQLSLPLHQWEFVVVL